ncbi:MAG: hypothetical protein EXX96DRAFT_623643 [Benjaminiella poitrasii]|nr:MAG: hypothetical protein EXX96DRAFT_623643 [Benjaminiella poitrasii]
MRFSQRQRNLVVAVLDESGLNLMITLTESEWNVLREFGRCKPILEARQLIAKLFENYDCEEGVKYIRYALVTIIDLWESDLLRTAKKNNESWFRSDLYARLFTTEEKPTEAGTVEDVAKSKKLQHKILSLWQDQLGSDKLMHHLEATTCQWFGTKLVIRGTKLYINTTPSYVKARYTLPLARRDEKKKFTKLRAL